MRSNISGAVARPFSSRLSLLRFRLVQRAMVDFGRTLERIDRMERWAKRLRSAAMVDAIITIRHAVISLCYGARVRQGA